LTLVNYLMTFKVASLHSFDMKAPQRASETS
jgi:hypothetical protein